MEKFLEKIGKIAEKYDEFWSEVEEDFSNLSFLFLMIVLSFLPVIYWIWDKFHS